MTAAKHLEYQIIRRLLRRREASNEPRIAVQSRISRADSTPWVDRLIGILALTAALLVLGSYLEELLWAAVAGTTLLTLR